MKFGTCTLVGALLLAVGCDAFNPHKITVQQKLVAAQEAAAAHGWKAPMNMVAGGAERQYGDDYYDGECVI